MYPLPPKAHSLHHLEITTATMAFAEFPLRSIHPFNYQLLHLIFKTKLGLYYV